MTYIHETSEDPAAADAASTATASRLGAGARRTMRPAATVLAAAVMLAATGAGADAYERAAAKPAKNPGPRAAALLVPSNTNFKLTPKLERNTGFAGVTQPSVGVYCFAPKKGLKAKDAVPTMTVDFVQSFEQDGMVQWLSEATRFGCKASEIGAITLIPDEGGLMLRSNHVAFAIVVD